MRRRADFARVDNSERAMIYLTGRQLKFLWTIMESTVEVTEDTGVRLDATRLREKFNRALLRIEE